MLGNVIVVLSVPANVILLLALNNLPSVIFTQTYIALHEAAVVPDARIQVTIQRVPPANILTVFAPED